MNRRNLLLGTTGLALSAVGCRNRSVGALNLFSKQVTLDDCPALKSYIDSLCTIPEGDFLMGSPEFDFGLPLHRVALSQFRMGKTPVTVAMWQEYVFHLGLSMPSEPSPQFEGGRKFNIGWTDKAHPIVKVDWYDCQKYADWASKVGGVKLSLPSEAQWEYASRGGLEGKKYPWGNEFDRSKLWCSYEKYGDRGSTGSVNRQVYVWHEHPWNLIDMAGNVCSWCLDWYDPHWYEIPQSKEKDVVNLDSSPTVKIPYKDEELMDVSRCVRGGRWSDNDPLFFQCGIRRKFIPSKPSSEIGFRLVAPPK